MTDCVVSQVNCSMHMVLHSAATAKARSPMVDRRMYGTTSVRWTKISVLALIQVWRPAREVQTDTVVLTRCLVRFNTTSQRAPIFGVIQLLTLKKHMLPNHIDTQSRQYQKCCSWTWATIKWYQDRSIQSILNGASEDLFS